MRALSLAAALALPAAAVACQRPPADRQHPEGWWQAGPDRDGAHEGVPGVDEARATAAALLADLADRSTLKSGPRRDAVKLATHWLCGQQDEASGRVAELAGRDSALAAYALASVYTLSRYRALKPRVARAVSCAAADCAQDAAGGSNGDACALTLLAAEAAEMPLPGDVHARLVAAIEARASGRSPRIADLAALLVCRQQAGTAARDPTELERCAQLLAAADLMPPGEPRADELAILLATTALYRHGGAAWDAFTKKLVDLDEERPPDRGSTTAVALRGVTRSLLGRTGVVYGVPRPRTEVMDDAGAGGRVELPQGDRKE